MPELGEILNSLYKPTPSAQPTGWNGAVDLQAPFGELLRRASLYQLYRWFADLGTVPTDQEWAELGWQPDVEEIKWLFGGWEAFVADLEGQTLARCLPPLRQALAKREASFKAAEARLAARARDLGGQERRLSRREAEIRAELASDLQQQIEAANDAARRAGERQHQAEAAMAEALVSLAISTDERSLAERRSYALMRALVDPAPAKPAQFAAWHQFTGDAFEAVLGAAALVMGGEERHEQVEHAPNGTTEIELDDGLLEVERTNAKTIKLTHLRPLGSPVTRVPLAAFERLTVTIWRAAGQVGLLTEVHVVGCPASLPAARLAELSTRIVEASAPDSDAGWPVGTRATVVDKHGMGELASFLTNPDRSRPVILITSDPGLNVACDPDLLAAELCGAAHVVQLDAEATFNIGTHLPTELSVWGGQIRCYAPGLQKTSPSDAHMRVEPRKFDDRAALHNELLLVACDLDRVPEGLRQARHHGSAQDQQAASADEEKLQVKTAELRKRIRALEREVTSQSDTIEMLTSALESKGAPVEASRETIRSVADAVAQARKDSGHLQFTRKALKTADESPFRRPREVYDALMLLDRLAGEYTAGTMGLSVGERAAQLGLDWRTDVGVAARSKRPDDYSCVFNNITLALGPHVAIGNGSGASLHCRIYLCVWDGSEDVPRGIYVGHVGRHLPDSTTG